MGARWGINRTVAQIHALLYISPEPLNAEDITETLSVARSNASTSLRELQSWGIVKMVHVLGDKRDHFESLKDPWKMFRIILEERKRREFDPTLAVLRDCIDQAGRDSSSRESGAAEYSTERLRTLHDFMETLSSWHRQTSKWPDSVFTKFLKMGNRALKLLGLQ